MHYGYSAGARTLKTATDDAGQSLSTLEIFDSLRIESVIFQIDGAYRITEDNVHLYVGGLGHVFVDTNMPRPPASGYPDGDSVHMLIQIPDHLGSTGVVIDRATSEVVERASHQAYGAL